MVADALLQKHLPEREPVLRGKVRDLYYLGVNFVLVAADQIPAVYLGASVGILTTSTILTGM